MRDISAPTGSIVLLSVLLFGCAPSSEPIRVIDVVGAPGATGMGTRDASRAINGVRGAGDAMGSLDVYSLGAGDDAWIAFSLPGELTDGEGAELVVFENPFVIASGPARFMDPMVVEVSHDGETWAAFPHDYLAPDEARYSNAPSAWSGFAGITPVLLHDDDAPGDPFDPLAAGGDSFDLGALSGPRAELVLSEGVRFVRLVSARLRTNPETGAPFPHDPLSDGPDVDGLYVRYLR